MRKIQARKTNGEGVAFVVGLFSCCLQPRCDCCTGPGSHSPVSLSSPTDPGLLPPALGPQVPSVQPLAPHTHRAVNWALFLSWILPCSMDPNFYSIPETFCPAFPPSSILFIFHYLLQPPHSQVRRQESSWPRERGRTGRMPLAAIARSDPALGGSDPSRGG